MKIHINNDDNYATPPELYKEWNKEFNFDFDPCPYNEKKVLVDGLKIAWGGGKLHQPPVQQKIKRSICTQGCSRK